MDSHETTIVEITSLEDLAMELTNVVMQVAQPLIGDAKATAFMAQCKELIERPDLQGLVETLCGHMHTVLTSCTTADANNTFMLFFALLRYLEQDSLGPIVGRICELAQAHGSKDASVSLTVLRNLYSILPPTSPSRYVVYSCMVATVEQTKTVDVLSKDLTNLESLFVQWSSSTAQRATLLLAMSQAMEALGEDDVAQEFLLTYLRALDGVAAAQLSACAAQASKAAVAFIRNPFTKRDISVVNLDAVTNLANVPECKKLHELVRVFATGTLETFTTFQKSNAGFVKTQGLSDDECILNMRLLSLVSLVNNTTDFVSYSQVAKALNVELSSVEEWVVSAKTKNLVDAKLDQLNERIVINRGTGRAFDVEEWAGLAKKLGQWKSAVKTLLQEVQNAQDASNKTPVM